MSRTRDSVARWREDLAAYGEASVCPQGLFSPQSLAMTAVIAIREWGRGLLRLGTALV